MTIRTLLAVLVLAALGLGGWKELAPRLRGSSAAPTAYVSEATSAISDAALVSAGTSLEEYRLQAGTYSGAELHVPGATLSWANDSSYCIQSGSGTGAKHLQGPHGAVSPGPCPG